MRLQEAIIRNYRNLENVSVPFELFSALVGPNNIGKSSILQSLDYVFSQTNARNVQISKADFFDPSIPIIIDVILGDINEDDAAIFYHDDGIINPKNKTIRVRFVSTWSSVEQDVQNECYFVRDDLPENQERVTDFYSNYKQAVPFYLISSDRLASQEIGLTKNRDLGRVLRIYSSDYLKPLATLRAEILSAAKKIMGEKVNWVDFPEEKYTLLKKEVDEITNLIQNDFGQQLDRTTASSYTQQLEQFSDNWPNVSLPFDEFIPDNLEKPYIKFLQIILEKTPILMKRAKVQLSLHDLRSGILEERRFEEMSMGFKAIFNEMLPDQKLGVSLFSIQDDDLISQVSVDFDERSILANGSGFQSMFVIGLKLVRTLAQLRFSEVTNVRNFVLAIEEPENHLHPHMQRHFVNFIRKVQALWLKDGYQLQVIITTHSPSIICRYKPSELIHLKKEGGIVQANKWTNDTLFKIVQAQEPDIDKHGDVQQQLELCLESFLEQYADVFFSNLVIVVEGFSEEGAIPIWASKLSEPFDFDQLGICFLNAQGDRMKFYLRILEAFHLDYVVLYDSGDKHEIEWVDKAKMFPTKEKAFEKSIISSANIISLIEALLEIETPVSKNKRFSDIRQRITPFSNATNWEDAITILRTNSISEKDMEKLKSEISKWLSKRKNLILGRSIAKHTDESEIPENIKSMFSYSRTLINSKLGKTA
jgi:predicted ATP-dependent endonuclease of OLD family